MQIMNARFSQPPGAAALWRCLRALLLVLSLGLSLAGPLAAQGVQPVPDLTARVIDRTGTLQAADLASLDAKLKALEAEKGSQVVVLMVPTTQPEDIFSYSNRVANAWKIGRAQVGDGLLIVVAKDDRRMRIEVSKTLEGAVTDISSGRIINEAMAPRFRADDYAGGIEAAVDAVSALIRNEPLPLPSPATPARGPAMLGEILPFVFFAVFVGMQVLRRFASGALVSAIMGVGAGLFVGWVTQSLLWGIVAGVAAAFMGLFSRVPVSSGSGGWGGGGSGGWSSGRGGDGFGGGGGGGFSSGGGGSFGGGGASGRW